MSEFTTNFGLPEWASLIFFVFFCGLALLRPLDPKRRFKIIALGVSGMARLFAPLAIGRYGLLLQQLVPLALIPLAYWQTGHFSAPIHERLQMILAASDETVLRFLDTLGISRSRLRRMDFAFELAYLFVYPMVPSGLAVLYFAGRFDRAHEYWSVVLPAAYVCYATLPFLRTLPPRLLETSEPRNMDRRDVRSFNLVVVRLITHESNTFPSGHAAAAVAVAVELIRWVPEVGIFYAVLAIGIMAGAFVGRYHYALDLVVGAVIALLSFVIVIATRLP